MGYSIKQVSEKTGLTPYVLRYYEKEGILTDIHRSESGIRCYSDGDLEWLGLVCCLKNTGMSLKQIRDFMDLSLQGPHTLGRRCEMLVEHKRSVEAQIGKMQQHLEKVSCKISHFRELQEVYLAKQADHRIPESTH